MIYSGDANGQDIVTYVDTVLDTNSVSFPVNEKTLYANEGVKKILTWIIDASATWKVDDTNQTDLPESTTNLVSGLGIYALPTEADIIDGFSFKESNGIWTDLIPITLEQIPGAEDEFYKTNGKPQYYRLIGNQVEIYPASNFSQDDSLKVRFQRDGVLFTPASTTAKPGFSSRFHEAIPTYIILKYAKKNSLSIQTTYQEEWDGNEDKTGREGGYKKAIKDFYNKTFSELFPPNIKHSDYLSELI